MRTVKRGIGRPGWVPRGVDRPITRQRHPHSLDCSVTYSCTARGLATASYIAWIHLGLQIALSCRAHVSEACPGLVRSRLAPKSSEGSASNEPLHSLVLPQDKGHELRRIQDNLDASLADRITLQSRCWTAIKIYKPRIQRSVSCWAH